MNPLLITSMVVIVGTLLGTQKQTDTYQDKIFKIRDKAKESEEKEIEKSLINGKLYQKRNGKSGKSYHLNQKKVSRERYVRNLLQTMFRYRFPSIRPKWLLNPKTGRRLEIDCYCKEMRLCIEIDGCQHHRYTPFFHRTYQEFINMKERDQIKSLLIRKRGLKLIRLPFNVPDCDIETYLLQAINKVM